MHILTVLEFLLYFFVTKNYIHRPMQRERSCTMHSTIEHLQITDKIHYHTHFNKLGEFTDDYFTKTHGSLKKAKEYLQNPRY